MKKFKKISGVFGLVLVFCLSLVLAFNFIQNKDNASNESNEQVEKVQPVYYNGIYYASAEDSTGASTAAKSENGGAVYVGNGSTFDLEGGIIEAHTATYGGAIFIANGGTFTMTAGTITGNSATYGGAIYVEKGGTCNIEGGTIISNTATEGGAIYVEDGGNLKVSQSVTIDGGTVEEGGSETEETQLDAPTISIDGDMLNINDESGLATSFDILVDGETKTTIAATNAAVAAAATSTDLTNTSWYVPSGWSATAGYGKFNITGDIESVEIGGYFAIGYSTTGTSYNEVSDTVAHGETYIGYDAYSNTKDFTITITGGDDVTNTSLISWLEANGELQTNGSVLTFDLTSLGLTSGTYSITAKAKADGYADSAESGAVSYTVAATTKTIAAGTYVIEDGYHDGGEMEGTYSIAFTSNSVSYTSIEFAYEGMGYNIYYDSTKVASGSDVAATHFTNAEHKTITISADQEVSAEFAEWFNANFTKQETTKMIMGTWNAIDSPSGIFYPDEAITQSVNFTSNDTSYTSITISQILSGDDPALKYGSTTVATYSESFSWSKTAYKTINFGDVEQEVSAEFYEWLSANFILKQETGGSN